MSQKQKKITAKEKCLQRLLSLKNALESFKEAYSFYLKNPESKIYRMALIKGFEFSFELSWVTLKYFIQYKDLVVFKYATGSIKHAFNKDIIKDDNLWLDMLEARNKLSHVYDEELAQHFIERISNKYMTELDKFYHFIKKEI